MSTKKSLLQTKDVNGQIIKLDDRVAYPKNSRNGYNVTVHTGTVKRITERCIWILPDEQFKNDKCGYTHPITNGEPRYIIDENAATRWTKYKYNNKFKILGYEKSMVHDWYMRRADRCVKI